MSRVLIVGSGIAGLSCAIFCAELGLQTTLVSPYPSERSQSVMAAGGINAALATAGEPDSAELHAQDTLRGGCDIADAQAVRGMCEAAPDIISCLESMGTVFTRDAQGRSDLRAFGGQSRRRTVYAGAATGKQLVTALVLKAREYEAAGRICRRYGLWFHSALIRDGECRGVLFFNELGRDMQAIYADAVIMATGGQNGLFGKTTGSTLCDGYAVGRLFMQGAELKNEEFIQYHPTTLETPQKRMLISEAARGEGGRLYYLSGGRRVYFMEELYGEGGNLMPRDIVSKCIWDAPGQVYLDLSHLPAAVIDGRLGEVRDLCARYGGIDVKRESIPVAPSVHFFMGGLAVNREHRTSIGRLYAIGECACQYHGANRLGGNSLLAAVYGGRVAAQAAAGESRCEEGDHSAYIQQQQKALEALLQQKSQFSAMYIRSDLAKIMQDCLGITRNEQRLTEGAKSVDYYLSVCDRLYYDSGFSPYQAYSLKSILVLARAVFAAALARRESRGAHIREDHPSRDDRFRAPSYIRFDGGAYTVRFEEEEQG